MNNLQNIELISINTEKGEAIISYQDINNCDNINNGYSFMAIPINFRKLQYSSNGGILIDQSQKSEILVCNSDTNR
jgi:hypothetical protein